MKAKDYVQCLTDNGFGPFTGVPCSILNPVISFIENNEEKYHYVSAANEGEAMGIAAGFSLAGKVPVVMMQNSGLGNIVNPLTSLTRMYKLKTLMIITLRGEVGKKDEPQHFLMGQITENLLELLGIKYEYLDESNYKQKICDLFDYINNNDATAAIIIKDKQFEEFSIETKSLGYMNRYDAIKVISEAVKERYPIISTTGKISRELYFSNDSSNNFYVFGSMGCASAIGLGVALSNQNVKVVVLDGDGAVLMKLGNLSTIGSQKLNNYLHFVLDNEAYDSTGGQRTNTRSTRIDEVAKGCAYDRTYYVTELEELKDIVDREIKSEGCAMVLVKISRGSSGSLGRPSESPEFFKERFSDYLKSV